MFELDKEKCKCEYWEYFGADEMGDFQACKLEDSPELMVACSGDKAQCRNKALREEEQCRKK